MPPSISVLESRLKIQHLRLLLAIAEGGTLRKAAERLSLTQPAVTKNLQDLETLLGVPLYERHARGMRPTRFCEPALRYAKIVFGDLASFRDELVAIGAGKIGKIRIGTIMAPALGLVSEAVSSMSRDYPQLQTTLMVDTSDVLLSLLDKDQIDIALGRVPEHFHEGTFKVQELGEELLSVVVQCEHPLTNSTPQSLAELAEFPWILQPRPSPMRQLIDHWFDDAGLGSPRCTIETAALLMTMALLQNSNMIAVLPASVAQYFVRLGVLAIIPIEIPRKLGPFAFITRQGRETTTAMGVFMDAVRENLTGTRR